MTILSMLMTAQLLLTMALCSIDTVVDKADNHDMMVVMTIAKTSLLGNNV